MRESLGLYAKLWSWVAGVMLLSDVSGRAASIQVNGGTILTTQMWTNLQSILAGAASNDVIKVSGDVTRTTNDATLAISASGVTLSGGWDSGFTSQAWKGDKGLAAEIAHYSVLDAASDASHTCRVMTVKGAAANVMIEGFGVRNGYVTPASGADDAGGIYVISGATGARLNHLYLTGNTIAQDWNNGGGAAIDLNALNGRLEYLTVAGNTSRGIGGNGIAMYGAIKVGGSGGGMVACVHVQNHTYADINPSYAGETGWGSGIGFVNNGSASLNILFGSLVRGCPNLNAVSMGGNVGGDNGQPFHSPYLVTMANSTVVDNTGAFAASAYMFQMAVVNSVLADNNTAGQGIRSGSSGGVYSFINCYTTLFDTTSAFGSSTNGTIYGSRSASGSGIYDGGGNKQVSDALFKNQAACDYMLSSSSEGLGTALAKYDGRGFAYVEINGTAGYQAGADVIVDILRSSTYVPASSEYYYPTDINGNEWIGARRYVSDAELAGTMNMGGLGPRPPPMGTVVAIR